MDAVTAAESNVTLYDSVAPNWLTRLAGPEFFCRIERVHGLYRKMSDEHLAPLSRVSELKGIATNHAWMGSAIGTFSIASGGNMDQSPLISDAGLASISEIRNLESLILFNTAVTDDGIAQLSKLRNLQVLMIGSLHITDDSIPHLSQLKSLQRLWTAGTSITSSGVDLLRQALPDCEIFPGDKEVSSFSVR